MARRYPWIGYLAITLILLMSVSAGFVIGMIEPDEGDQAANTYPVDEEVQLGTRYRARNIDLDSGWDKQEDWGTWMVGQRAAILLGLEGPAEGDVLMQIDARAGKVGTPESPLLIVRFNDVEIGRWALPPKSDPMHRIFIVPAAVFNKSTLARVSFEYAGKSAQKRGFGIEKLWLRDARNVLDFIGVLDHCAPDKLEGWAIGDATALNVTAFVQGVPLPATISNVDRPDLPKHGLPLEAGFVIRPSTPIKAGTSVEVRFPNGRGLRRSPCRLPQ